MNETSDINSTPNPMDGEVTKPSSRSRNRRKTRSKKSTTNQDVILDNIALNISDLSLNTFDLDQIQSTSSKRNKKRKNLPKQIDDENIPSGSKPKNAPRVLVFRNSKYVNASPTKLNNKNDHKSSGKKEDTKPEVFENYLSLVEVNEGLKTGELFSGFIRINPKDFKLSYISNPEKSEQDVLIENLVERNRALDGDNVVIKLKDQSEWRSPSQKTGKVVYILENIHPRIAIGHLKLLPDRNKLFACFHPRDSRIPRFKIPFTDWPQNFYETADRFSKVLFLAKLTAWTDPKFGLGTLVENVGESGEIKAETKAILVENSLDVTPYGEEYKQYFPKTCDILPEEFESRLDLRKECIFTIDPLTARDLDDAVSCKELPNGNLEVGVHIADVTYYLKEGTPLDDMVAGKATSIYMVQCVYHMLPKELCMICSLLPGEDKLAFSVIWEMTPAGEIISTKFCRTIINSCVQLAYEHAQLMIDDPAKKQYTANELPQIHNGYTSADLVRVVSHLQQIALNLRKARFDNGALRIDQPKVGFSIDPVTCLPISYQIYENKDCHRLIEEFMLLANISVASRLRDDYPDIAFLRSHPEPHQYMMKQLKQTLEKVGIHLDIETAGGLQQTLWKYSGEDLISQARMMVLSLLCAKPMNRAIYFCSGKVEDEDSYSHYALSIPLYTHFTSPIRRYADCMVHRLLEGSLGYADRPKWTTDFVHAIANNCNRQKYNAKRADEQSCELYLLHYIKQNQPVIENAVVMDVKDSSFDVLIIANGLNVRIYCNKLDDNVQYKYIGEKDENDKESKKLYNLMLQWPPIPGKACVRQYISLFSVILVSLTKHEKASKIEAKLVRPNE